MLKKGGGLGDFRVTVLLLLALSCGNTEHLIKTAY